MANDTTTIIKASSKANFSKTSVLKMLHNLIDDYEAGDERVKATDYLRSLDMINKMKGHYEQSKKAPDNQQFTFRFD